MPPRIVTIADHVDCPTGFGVQHRHLAVGLARAGFEVHSLGIWDSRPLAAVDVWEGGRVGASEDKSRGEPTLPRSNGLTLSRSTGSLTRYPGGLGPEDHRRAWAMYRDLLRPDLVITLGDLRTFAHLARGGRPFAWCHWLPLDALPYPARDHATLLRLDRLVLMSHFAMGVVRPHLEGRVPLHLISHGVDLSVFHPLDDPLALRRRWTSGANGHPPLRTLDGSPLRPDDFVLISRDANQWRKQQPLLLEALGKLPRDVKLILHCHPVAHPNARGWDLPLAAELYGVADRVAFTCGARAPERAGHRFSAVSCRGPIPKAPTRSSSSDPDNRKPTTENPLSFLPLSPAEIAELDNLADLRVSATMGEGFGVLTIEAMACGTPTVITDYTTSRELILGISDCRLPIANWRTADPGQAGLSSIGNPQSEIGNVPDPFGPAGDLVRVAAWTLEQDRHLLRPVADAADLAAKILALRDDPARLARCAAAGLRRVLARYTVGHMVQAWVQLVREALG
jgi:glycosyltransferase involved in cell wall biosynthesis